MFVSFAQLLICWTGLVDMASMMATLCGWTMVMSVEVPMSALYLIPMPHLNIVWFTLALLTCTLFWMASANMIFLSYTSQLENYRQVGFLPWFVMGMIVMFFSLLTHAFEGSGVVTVVLVVLRIISIFVVYLSVERWEWEQTDLVIYDVEVEEIHYDQEKNEDDEEDDEEDDDEDDGEEQEQDDDDEEEGEDLPPAYHERED